MAASASQVTPYPVTVRSRVVLGVAVLAGTTVALALVLRGRAGSATDVLRVAAGCFASLVAACAYLEPAWAERSATTRLASSE
jgi:hypothetical protein